MNDVKTHVTRFLVQVERGQRNVITQAGRPVAELRPARGLKRSAIPVDEPLHRVDEYAYAGPIGPTSNRDIDNTVYGV